MPRRQTLRDQLLAFTPADAAEAGHRGRMLRLIDSADDPFSRRHFEPGHFTASAFVLSPDARELLLIFHGKFQRWLQPGGHVDSGDADLAAAARREVLEEAGLDSLVLASALPFDLDVHPIPPHPGRGEPPHEHFDVRYLFTAADLAHTAGSDAHAARWVLLEDVSESMTDASVMRAVSKLRGTSRCSHRQVAKSAKEGKERTTKNTK